VYDGRFIPCGQPLDFSMEGFDLALICQRGRMLTRSSRTECTVTSGTCYHAIKRCGQCRSIRLTNRATPNLN
jgi:hypothetical protein